MPLILPQIKLQELIEELQGFLQTAALDLRYRVRPEDFTRKRLLPFEVVAVSILSAMKRTLGVELEEFFSVLNSRAVPTPSAYSQARAKVRAEFFEAWCECFNRLLYGYEHQTLSGLRAIGVDGFQMHIPDTPEIRSVFPPVFNKRSESTLSRVLCYYDVLNQHAILTKLEPVEKAENRIAGSCLEHFGSHDLLIYDRQFPSWAMFYMHQLRSIPFIMRCRVGFSKQVAAFVKSGKPETVIQMATTVESVASLQMHGISVAKGQSLTIRLIRVELENTDEPEILATNLLDTDQFPCSAFKEIYFHRWGIETFFDRLKNKLQIEIFSGNSVAALKMDFFAMVFLANLQSFFLRAAMSEVIQTTSGRKHQYQPNWNKALGYLKGAIVVIMLGDCLSQTLEMLIAKIAASRNLEPVRKGRQFPRIWRKRQLNSKHRNPPNYKRAI
jgi:hypothetical protein